MLTALVGMLKLTLGVAVVGTIVVAMIVSLYRNNRLLFKCIIAVLIGHVATAAIIYGAGVLLAKHPPKERRVDITFVKPPPPPPKKKEIPKPKPKEEIKPLNIPLGNPNSKSKSKKMPHGHTLKSLHSAPRSHGGRSIVSHSAGGPGEIPVDPNPADDLSGPGDPNVADVGHLPAVGDGDAGTPDGEGSGDVPVGFVNGKIGGRVYFIRLKHGTGAWNMYDDGTKRLLAFLNQQSFPCETETRAKTAPEIRDKYLKKNQPPTFLYIYCDDTFKLSGSDVAVLREYLDQGGFLFMDSSPDTYVKDRVAKELDKVLPGTQLQALPFSHPINTFLFRLPFNAVGMNTVTSKNYGVARNGRLVVFYTMGNFGQIYSLNAANSDEYFTAQYQMGANVMVYAIMKGDASSIEKRAGAKATITQSVLEKMGLLTAPTTKPAAHEGPPESVKIKKPVVLDKNGKPVPQTPTDDPDEIKLLEQ